MKRILFIAPNFYNYHIIIENGLIDAGYEVDYFDDRPDTKFFTKALLRINKKFLNRKIKKYFDTILAKAKEREYDLVFVLYGQSFSTSMIQQLKAVLPNAEFVFYMYDPIYSMPDRVEFSKLFDRCYTFDYADSQALDNFELLPLFYSFADYDEKPIKYQACYIGTMMPGKYIQVKEMVKQLRRNGFNVYSFSYLQSKLVWLYYKLTKKEFRHSKVNEFVYKRMSMIEANDILECSNIVIDCPKEGQTGLTIRTFEALAANKKLVTTNETIKFYDFYKPENIYIFKGVFDFDDVFFHSGYVEISEDIKQKYALENWIKKIVGD